MNTVAPTVTVVPELFTLTETATELANSARTAGEDHHARRLADRPLQ